ncbi:MAG TPA: hypothetical protein VK435_10985, partial [Thermodesulfovibrionales bacterium]|nr:hypothetical protein [Thermodesulfovibrionales bacterium]
MGLFWEIRWAAPPSAVTFDLQYLVNGGSTWKSISDKMTGSSYDWQSRCTAMWCAVARLLYDEHLITE